ncbi:MAG: hypothetical protein P8K77_03190 [Polaribacter sp.]|nr:hypothetical protein [Polaribacter sp.]
MYKSRKVRENKIPKAFFVALVFALLFWSLIKLSKDYKVVVSVPVSYVNLPQDKLIQKAPLANIEVQVQGTGFRLIGLGFANNAIDLDAKNLQKKEGSEYFFLIQNQKASIQSQLSESYEIKAIFQDTLFLDLGLLISKKVPVIANLDLEYKLGFHLLDKLVLAPDSILVFGPEGQVNDLESLELEARELKDVSENIKEEIAIKKPISLDKIKYTNEKVMVIGTVDRFTEGTIELPFEIVNLPEGISVNTFPKTVRVVYQVGLSNFNKIDKNSFKISCDYSHSELNNVTYLVPKISNKPNFVTSVKLIPNKVEFLIQK